MKTKSTTYKLFSMFVVLATVLWSLGSSAFLLFDPTPVNATFGVPIKISEVRVHYGAGELDPSYTYVELYNSSTETYDVGNQLKLQYKWNSGSWVDLTNSFDCVMQAGKFFLIGTSDVDPAVDVEFINPDTFLDLLSSNVTTNGNIDGLALRVFVPATDFIGDQIGFGAGSDYVGTEISTSGWDNSKSFERKALSSSTAERLAPGGGDEFLGNSWESEDNGWDFVMQVSPAPQNSSSPAESFGEYQMDDFIPGIDHQEPLYRVSDDQDLDIFVPIWDDDPENLTASLFYGTSSPTTEVSATKTVQGLQGNPVWQFTIPQADLTDAKNTQTTIKYYFSVTDTNENTVTMPDYQPTTYPYEFSVVETNTGSFTFSGTVTDGTGSALQNALVDIAGTEFYTHTNASGQFSFSNLPSPLNFQGEYNVLITADNRPVINYFVGNGDSVNWDMAEDFTGPAGDMSKPFVIWTAPNDGMDGAPISICSIDDDPTQFGFDYCAPIIVEFSKGMKQSSLNSTNITLYDWNDQEDETISIAETGVIPNEYQIYSNSGLDYSHTYTLRLSENIKDADDNALDVGPSGYYELSFTTHGEGFTGGEGQTFGAGAYQPPFITNVSPNPGAWDVPLNSKMNLKFETTVDVSSTNLDRIKLFKMVGGNSVEVTTTKSYTSDNSTVIVTPSANMDASSSYRLVVYGSFESSLGVSLGDPQSNQNTDSYEFFDTFFDTNSVSDTTGPRVVGTYPSNNDTNIPLGLNVIDIAFNEALDATTVKGSYITFKKGSDIIDADIVWENGDQSVKILPKSALSAGSRYTLTVTTNVTDVAGNAMNQDQDSTNGESNEDKYVLTFETESSIETVAPNIDNVTCDDYTCVVVFDEMMNRANLQASGTTWSDGADKWDTSVININNYTLIVGDDGSNSQVDLANTQMFYDAEHNAVKIEGLNLYNDLPEGALADFSMIVNGHATNGVRDAVGNDMEGSQSFGGPIQNSAETGGFIGPGADGFGKDGASDFGMYGAEDMGINPIGVWPMNALAGTTTRYFVDLPITKQISSGGEILLTFPNGFDVSSAEDDDQSPMNYDINGPGPGQLTVNCSGSTTKIISCILSGDTATNDYLNFELKGIVNSSIPKDFDTNGYTVDITT